FSPFSKISTALPPMMGAPPYASCVGKYDASPSFRSGTATWVVTRVHAATRHSRMTTVIHWYLMAGMRGSSSPASVAWPLLPILSGYAHAPNLPCGRPSRARRSELALHLRAHLVESGRRLLSAGAAAGDHRRRVGAGHPRRAAAVRLRLPARALPRARRDRVRRAGARDPLARLRRRVRDGRRAADTPGGAADRPGRAPDELRHRRALLRARPGPRRPTLGCGAHWLSRGREFHRGRLQSGSRLSAGRRP